MLLAVVTQAASTTLVGAVAVFTAYAAGSGLLLITLALLATVAGHTLARAMQRIARYAGRIAGALLAVSGAYLLLYWLPQLLGTPRLGDAGLAELAGLVATAIADHQLAVELAGPRWTWAFTSSVQDVASEGMSRRGQSVGYSISGQIPTAVLVVACAGWLLWRAVSSVERSSRNSRSVWSISPMR